MVVYICDDDKVCGQELENFVINYGKKNNMALTVKRFDSGKSLMEKIRTNRNVDIIFMDIELGKCTGIELVEEINKGEYKKIEIVYVSAYNEYVFDVFRTRPADYVIKPVEQDRINQVLDRLVSEIMIENYVIIVSKKSTLRVNLEDIIYIESEGRKLNIYKTKGQNEIYMKLDEMNKIVEEKANYFIRPSKSYLVNLKFVEMYQPDKITLRDGKIINISRAMKSDVRSKYIKYMESL